MPQSKPAGQFLQGRLRAGRQHLDAARGIGKVAQRRRCDRAGGEEIGLGDGLEIGKVGLDAPHGGCCQRPLQGGYSASAISARDDDLRKHRIIIGCHLGAGFDPGVDASLFREDHFGQQSGARLKVGVRDLGIKPGLNRGALRDQRACRADDVLAGRLPDHPCHQIDAEHRLRDGMLDLQPRVDLEEGEILSHGIVDEFDGPRRSVGDAFAEPHRGPMQPHAGGAGEARCRRLLDDLLVAALQRTVPLAERNDAAPAVAKNLHFDMPGIGDEALEIDAGVAEAGLSGAFDGLKAVAQRVRRRTEAHADAAATRRAFQHDGIADGLGRRERRLGVGKQIRAGKQRHAAGLGEIPRRMFEAERAKVLWARPDEGDALRREPFGEADIFRQEAIPGMHGLGAGRATGG